MKNKIIKEKHRRLLQFVTEENGKAKPIIKSTNYKTIILMNNKDFYSPKDTVDKVTGWENEKRYMKYLIHKILANK